jgi:hypothetical protein
LQPLGFSIVETNMPPSLLYCGDTDLSGAASYLAGLMTLWGWEYDYVPSHVPLTREHVDKPRSLFIFSDYPAMQVTPECHAAVMQRVHRGAGLLMIGGWESFHGLGGDWNETLIGDALPVLIGKRDDRLNFYQPTLLVQEPSFGHPVLAGLPWDTETPTIGGMNRVKPKPQTQELLFAIKHRAREWDGEFIFEKRSQYPALVVGKAKKGRTAAFMSDVAPHWVGGFVDWGDARVTAQAPGAPGIEVGNWYAQFWRQLLSWTGRLS